MNEIKERIKQFLSESLPGEGKSHLRDDSRLRTSGLVDSIELLRLVSFVEEAFGIEVKAHEASTDNFDCIEDIAAFVQRKRMLTASKA